MGGPKALIPFSAKYSRVFSCFAFSLILGNLSSCALNICTILTCLSLVSEVGATHVVPIVQFGTHKVNLETVEYGDG